MEVVLFVPPPGAQDWTRGRNVLVDWAAREDGPASGVGARLPDQVLGSGAPPDVERPPSRARMALATASRVTFGCSELAISMPPRVRAPNSRRAKVSGSST